MIITLDVGRPVKSQGMRVVIYRPLIYINIVVCGPPLLDVGKEDILSRGEEGTKKEEIVRNRRSYKTDYIKHYTQKHPENFPFELGKTFVVGRVGSTGNLFIYCLTY